MHYRQLIIGSLLAIISSLLFGCIAPTTIQQTETDKTTQRLTAPPSTTVQPTTKNQGTSMLEIHPQVTQIDVLRGLNYVYLIRGERIALIDTGLMATTRNITSALKELGMTLADIDLIINTCVHGDHTGGDAAVQRASDAQIYIHASVADHLENPELAFLEQAAPNIEAILGKEYVEQRKAQYLNNTPGAKVTKRLNEGDVIELGESLELKVLHLPGHTPGDIGLFIEEEGMLFAGGSIRGVNGIEGALPVIEDIDAYEKTIERLQELHLNTIVLTHPSRSFTIPSTHILRNDEIDTYLKEILESISIMRQVALDIAPDFSEKPFWDSYDDFVIRLPREWGLKTTGEIGQQPFFGGVTFLNLMKKIK